MLMTFMRVALVIVLTCGLAAEQSSAPERAPADLRAKIEAVVAAGRAPSIAVAVARDGHVVWSDAFGVADKTRGHAGGGHDAVRRRVIDEDLHGDGADGAQRTAPARARRFD